jgi:hypothetical protein
MSKLIILAFLTLDGGVAQEDPGGGSIYDEWSLFLSDDSWVRR